MYSTTDEDKDDDARRTSAQKCPSTSPKKPCRGVKKYIVHNDRGRRDSLESYEKLLLSGKKKTFIGCKGNSKKCTATWWKVFVLVGIILLLVGVSCVLYAYLSPAKPDLLSLGPSVATRLDYAGGLAQNRELETFKLVGLILFCVGGLTLAVALMIPSFLYRYLEDEEDGGLIHNDGFHIAATAYRYAGIAAPTTTTKTETTKSIPVTSRLSEVQPFGEELIGHRNEAFRVK